MNEDQGHTPDEEDETQQPEFLYELKSAKEAAELLRISESTVWRYADQELLPTYRLGPKKIMFRTSDLESLIYRVPRRKKKPTVNMTERLRLTAMREGEARASAELVARAASLRDEILTRRGGAVTTAAWEDINASREERSADL